MTIQTALVLLLALLVCWRIARATARFAVIVAALAIASSSGCQGDTAPTSRHGNASAALTRWVDGDTARVSINGRDATIRLLGISAPETHRTPRCGGHEATAYMRRIAPAGTRVSVTTNAATGDVVDAYGRTLAYLDADDIDLGQSLIRAGHATVYSYRGRRFSRLARYQNAERSARTARSGSWRRCPGFADRR